ncbi:hypothetical protein BJX70DRAFT_287972 [Aspergillus crustosus]
MLPSFAYIWRSCPFCNLRLACWFMYRFLYRGYLLPFPSLDGCLYDSLVLLFIYFGPYISLQLFSCLSPYSFYRMHGWYELPLEMNIRLIYRGI